MATRMDRKIAEGPKNFWANFSFQKPPTCCASELHAGPGDVKGWSMSVVTTVYTLFIVIITDVPSNYTVIDYQLTV